MNLKLYINYQNQRLFLRLQFSVGKIFLIIRFSDIEWLHQGLLDYNPGCLIPKLPEKNFWANLYFDTSEFLNKRMKEIDVYLTYINSHKHLNKNPMYIAFLSDVI